MILFMNTMIQDSRTLVDIASRKQTIFVERRFEAAALCNHDVSQWVLGYILGVEYGKTRRWRIPIYAGSKSYHGKYMMTRKKASPFERAGAE